MRFASLALIFALASCAAIVDRIAIVIDRQVITQSQIDEELRVAAFLNQETLKGDTPSRHAAADRLVAQHLIAREMEISNDLKPTLAEVDAYLQQVKNTLGAASFQSDLATYGLTERVLREHLALQLTTLKFVDYRFRPETHAAINSGRTLEQETDEALTSWLDQRRRQVKIVYLDQSLK